MFRGLVAGDLVHVPYKGGGPAAVDVMSGQVPMAFISLPTVMGYVKGGRMRLIAISDSKRSSSVPEVPTMSETLPGFEVNNWLGVLAPAAIAKPLVAKLNADMHKALQAPDVREKLFLQGFEVQGGSPEQFGKMIQADIRKYTKVIREAHIQAN
jgi:tripartite-type tricarboxylate transporter receptor subunit TctC